MTVIVRGRAGAELGRTVVGAAAAALLGAEARLVDQACGQVGMITVHAAVDHRDLAALAAQAERIQTRNLVDQTGLIGRERRARTSEEGRVGEEGVSTCRARWSPEPSKKKNKQKEK